MTPQWWSQWFGELVWRLRNHRLFLVVFSAGVLLRILTQVAYWPAVAFSDSGAYIQNADHLTPQLWHPIGYALFLRPFLPFHSVAAVTITQHILGLVAGTLVYRVTRRFGAGPVLGSIAAAVFLLDPMQVFLEQDVLSDVLFAFLLVVAITLFIRRRLTVSLAVVGGLLIAASTTTRAIALAAVVPLGAYLLARRVSWRVLTATGVAIVVPLAGYALAFHAATGRFGFQGYSGRWLYSRVAPFAACSPDEVPDDARPLCPTGPGSSRPNPAEYAWDAHMQYQALGLPRDGQARSRLAGTFARDVIVHQPLAYLGAVTSDVLDAFKPGRNSTANQWFAGSWTFYLPNNPPLWRTQMLTNPFGSKAPTQPHLDLGLARALHAYGNVVYTPGPLAALAVLAFAAAAVMRRARGRAEMVLLFTTGALLLVVPIMTVDFDYRYILPGMQLIVAGGAIGTAFVARRIRIRHRSWWKVRRVVVPVVAAGLAAGNFLALPVYADGHYLPSQRVGPNVVVASEGGRFDASIASLRVLGRRVWPHKWIYRYRTCLTIEWRSGPPMLVSADNLRFDVPKDATAYVGMPAHPDPEQFTPMVLSAAHPTETAALDIVYKAQPTGRLRVDYIDPLGAGGIAWSIPLVARPSDPAYDCNAPGNPESVDDPMPYPSTHDGVDALRVS